MTNHPPIPPNCPYFFENKDGAFFSVVDGQKPLMQQVGATIIRLCNVSPEWRPIIAAVAEVAWLREAERIYQEAKADDCADLIFHEGNEDNGYFVATRNAHAWREWGEQGVTA